ncbi:molecular chaperone TorD family protein [Bacillus sp. Bva_UNVM-123]|uniref:molecular chaperone n=1 Tax=Bacillus sp. Bva_UNVM-123 TaxID=2829798 RepID=UPI00391FBC48
MEIVMDKEISLNSKDRETIYSFLKIVFDKPLATETLQLWKENFSSEFIEVLTEDNKDLQDFFTDLKRTDLHFIEQREREVYLATFNIFNEAGKIPAPPWESVYVTKDQSLFGENVFQLREKLHQFGLQYKDENLDPEDHISVQLEFMSYLINYTGNAFEERNENDFARGIIHQYWLLNNHLMQWVRPFTTDIISSTTSTLYRGSAKLLLNFIIEEYEYMKDLKEVLENE